MADLLMNLDFSSVPSGPINEQGNSKHKKFLKKRRFLERRGFLKQKQLPQKLPNRKPPENPKDRSNKPNGQKGVHDRTGRVHINIFHQKGAPHTSSKTITAPQQAGAIKCAPNHPHPASSTTKTGAAPKPEKPLMVQPELVSEYDSGLPSSRLVPSHKIVAIDCEMVGTGPKGQVSSLARCSIVSYHGDVMYDKYVKPPCHIVNYRTRWSGIRKEHMLKATPFKVAQKEVLKLLQGKVVIGHAIENDYKALGYFHPKEMTRDTSKMPQLNRKAGFPETQVVSLKRLAKQILQKEIQMGRQGHSSVEDARTTMELYRAVESEYEIERAEGKIPQ